MTNVFVQNLCFYRAWFSIQRLFKSMPCPLKRQRENHTGVLVSDSSHEYIVDRRQCVFFRLKSLERFVFEFSTGDVINGVGFGGFV